MDSRDTQFMKFCGNTHTHDRHFWISQAEIPGLSWDEFCPGVNVDDIIPAETNQ
jgi:hypothetical protein